MDKLKREDLWSLEDYAKKREVFREQVMRHLVLQPYRAVRPGASLAGLIRQPGLRHHIAMYDAVLEIMLKGYADLAGLRLRPESGLVAVKLMHLGFAFDDELEHRTAATVTVSMKIQPGTDLFTDLSRANFNAPNPINLTDRAGA